MKYRQLQKLNEEILKTREPGVKTSYQPVINLILPSQKYLIVSSDPSSDTDRTGDLYDKHSSFEERILALVFTGSDEKASLQQIRQAHRTYSEIFSKHFYWAHVSPVYAAGSPSKFWADRFLTKEIELFEPKVIVTFGSIAADFLFGKGSFKDRVNRILYWRRIPTICCLHPSRDWNTYRRPEFQFDQTWDLIRKTCKLSPEDKKVLSKLKNQKISLFNI
jgi:uracil-DNA glycosylase